MKSRYPQIVDNLQELEFTTWPRRIIPYFIAGLGLFLLVLGILINYIKTNQSNTVSRETENGVENKAEPKVAKLIKVHIDGAINRPGIVEIQYDSRIQDVLIAAGGLGANADRIYLSKSINLAQRAVDGMKIYIPFEGEMISVSTAFTSDLTTEGKLVNVNSSSQTEIEGLPGVGPVTARKIIENRPYQRIEELLDRKIVGQSLYSKIAKLISI